MAPKASELLEHFPLRTGEPGEGSLFQGPWQVCGGTPEARNDALQGA